MSENLTARTLHGLKWSYVATFANAFLQIGFSAALARLLEPATFGLIAMAGIVLRFGKYFAQMGVGNALVQKEILRTEDIHAAFLLSSGLGSLFFVAMWLAAPGAALLFDQPEVIPVVRILSISFLITGVATSATSLLRRRLDFRTISIVEIVSYVLGYGGVGVPMAVLDYGVWSLVGAALSQNVLVAVLSHAVVRHGVSIVQRRSTYGHLFSFGSRVSIVGFLEFLGGTLDTIVLGRFFGATSLGLYNRAQMIIFVPMTKIGGSLSRVLLPSFSRLQSDLSRLRRVYLTSITLVATLIVPACVGVAIVAEDAVLLVLGDQWTASVPVLRVLSIAVCLNVLTHLGAVACEATAWLNVKIKIQIPFILVQVLLFYLFFDYGMVGIAVGFMVAEAMRHAAYVFVMGQLLTISLGRLARVYVPSLVYAAVIGVALYGVALLGRVQEWSVPLTFALELVTGAGMLGILILYGPMSDVRAGLVRILRRMEGNKVTSPLLRMLDTSAPDPAT